MGSFGFVIVEDFGSGSIRSQGSIYIILLTIQTISSQLLLIPCQFCLEFA